MKSILALTFAFISIASFAEGSGCEDNVRKANMAVLEAGRILNSVKTLSDKIVSPTCEKDDAVILSELRIAVESFDYLSKKAKNSLLTAEELYIEQYCDYKDSFEIDSARKRVAGLKTNSSEVIAKAKAQIACLK
ncbi:hypothetical protein M899_1242 [Bacteriovorax sp. BSW11_IV]|uniref:hypothetical protein n=1 Tax=Bacteriovorax sp. BSW11_IV TaxID=1353529 RepID=UPI000389F917|nr:hypothetical protein [Bacteriovorax sp. BSW11_IV]EQC45755.1 hypothetical protein M899_1242 [Bacteriovorax sp. BSW11_IV]